MALKIRVTTEVFEKKTAVTRYANSNEINVGVDATTLERVLLTEYPNSRHTPLNVEWQGSGTVLFKSLESIWTREWPIAPGDYVVKATLRSDTRYWCRRWINLSADGTVVVIDEDFGRP